MGHGRSEVEAEVPQRLSIIYPRKAAAPYWKSSWVVRDPFIRRSSG